MANVSHTVQSEHLDIKSITVFLVVLNMRRGVCWQPEKLEL